MSTEGSVMTGKVLMFGEDWNFSGPTRRRVLDRLAREGVEAEIGLYANMETLRAAAEAAQGKVGEVAVADIVAIAIHDSKPWQEDFSKFLEMHPDFLGDYTRVVVHGDWADIE